MIGSLYQIDFITTAGRSIRLLNFGDIILAEIAFPMEQNASNYTAIGAEWGTASAEGGARTAITWTREVDHASHAAARDYTQTHPVTMPILRDGKLRVAIQGGSTWDHLDAVLLAADSVPITEDVATTQTTYRVTAGRRLPVAGLALQPGFRWSWILTPWGALTPDWQDL